MNINSVMTTATSISLPSPAYIGQNIIIHNTGNAPITVSGAPINNSNGPLNINPQQTFIMVVANHNKWTAVENINTYEKDNPAEVFNDILKGK